MTAKIKHVALFALGLALFAVSILFPPAALVAKPLAVKLLGSASVAVAFFTKLEHVANVVAGLLKKLSGAGAAVLLIAAGLAMSSLSCAAAQKCVNDPTSAGCKAAAVVYDCTKGKIAELIPMVVGAAVDAVANGTSAGDELAKLEADGKSAGLDDLGCVVGTFLQKLGAKPMTLATSQPAESPDQLWATWKAAHGKMSTQYKLVGATW